MEDHGPLVRQIAPTPFTPSPAIVTTAPRNCPISPPARLVEPVECPDTSSVAPAETSRADILPRLERYGAHSVPAWISIVPEKALVMWFPVSTWARPAPFFTIFVTAAPIGSVYRMSPSDVSNVSTPSVRVVPASAGRVTLAATANAKDIFFITLFLSFTFIFKLMRWGGTRRSPSVFSGAP